MVFQIFRECPTIGENTPFFPLHLYFEENYREFIEAKSVKKNLQMNKTQEYRETFGDALRACPTDCLYEIFGKYGVCF